MDILITVFFSYLCGSIPFGLILTKIFKKQDIRKIGSGNIGATNVLRTGNKSLAIATLILDVVKGYVPVLITMKYFPEYIHLSALIVFLGHIFPLWLKFKGGKGVSTYLGIIFALSLKLGLFFCITWIVLAFISKYSSFSSIVSALVIFLISLLEINFELNLFLFTVFVIILYTHKQNIVRLKNKTEDKIKL